MIGLRISGHKLWPRRSNMTNSHMVNNSDFCNISRAGSLKYMVLSPELVPWNTWSYLCHHLWSWYLPFSRPHLWSIPWYTRSYLPPFLELIPAFSVVLSLGMAPWNTRCCQWHHFWSWCCKKTKTSTPELVISCSGRTVCYKKPVLEIGPRISRNQLWR